MRIFASELFLMKWFFWIAEFNFCIISKEKVCIRWFFNFLRMIFAFHWTLTKNHNSRKVKRNGVSEGEDLCGFPLWYNCFSCSECTQLTLTNCTDESKGKCFSKSTKLDHQSFLKCLTLFWGRIRWSSGRAS